MISVAEPNQEVEQPVEGETVEQGEAQETTVAEAVESDLADDTQLEITDASGAKQTVTLAQLRDIYLERDRHRKAADQKFTEADKIRKGVQGEVAKALRDPSSFLKWIETQRPDFKTVDYFFEQLEKDADPRVIDRLAQVLERKLKAEQEENQLTPEARRARELEQENQRLKQQYEEILDRQEEQVLFEGVRDAVAAAGLNPTPLVAVMALEIISQARERGVDLSKERAAAILKEQVSGAAERLFAKDTPRGPDGKFQAAPRSTKGAADAGMAAQAKRSAKENAPRVSVVKKNKKEEDKNSEEPLSFLEAIRRSYSSIN